MPKNLSQRSLSLSKNRNSRSGSLSLNNSQRNLKASNDYNNIDRLRSVNKIRPIDGIGSGSNYGRNFKSLSPKVSLSNKGGGSRTNL
jgi:hypothetical protein